MIPTVLGFVARFTTFAAVLAALGAVVFRVYVLERARLSNTVVVAAERRAANIAMIAAIAIIPAALLKLVLQTNDMRFPDDPWLSVGVRMITETAWGTTWLVQVACALLLMFGAAYTRRKKTRASLLPWIPVAILAIALAVTPSTSSHAMSAQKFSAITVYNDIAHVFAASTWLGTLFVMYRSVRGGDGRPIIDASQNELNDRAASFDALTVGHVPENESYAPLNTLAVALTEPTSARTPSEQSRDDDQYLPKLLAVFSPLALVCGALVVLSGLISSFSHIDTLSQFYTTVYGQTLLAKLASVAMIAAFGWRNFRYLTPALHKTGSAQMRRGMLLELAATVLVLLVTAVLVVTPPPMEGMPMN